MNPRRYSLVVFDFDGTLADSFPWFTGILNEVAARYRFRAVAEHETEMLRGLDARAIVRHLGIPAWKLPLITRHMHRLAARDIERIGLFPGIPAMLDGIAEGGIRLGIVSSNTEANIRAVLGAREAERFTDYGCGASLFGKARRLRKLIAGAGFTPDDVLYVGDEIRDFQAAQAVGCAFGAVAWGYTSRAALSRCNPELLFDKPSDIADAVRRSSAASQDVTA